MPKAEILSSGLNSDYRQGNPEAEQRRLCPSEVLPTHRSAPCARQNYGKDAGRALKITFNTAAARNAVRLHAAVRDRRRPLGRLRQCVIAGVVDPAARYKETTHHGKHGWVSHDDKPIFSVDVHPAGIRFATGGQGSDSGRVVVWNLNPVLSEASEMDPLVPKMLCQMDKHLACVNCVRWSNGGKYLASGGDDRLVMVWALSGPAINVGKNKFESWRCISTLRGHAGDVLDLAWSPLDKWLASCSVDNTIIIWNAEKFPEMVCVLNGHTGLVKGVAWDPVGKYLASQSDDKSLRVWKTADWAQESVITEPFEECGGTTHVLRLSWSPDGQYVLSAHAMNGGGPTAQVVERDGWRCDKDFVGHRKAVTCARFNSNIFVKEGKKCCCAAVGSRDRALSIWLTSLKRPLVVVHDLFSDSVLDLSWSSNGLNLLACSSDGTVACIQFTNKEIGTPLTLEEKNAFYEKIYGKCLVNESGNDLNNSNLLVECPEILLAREKQEAETKREREISSKEDTTPKADKSLTKPAFTPSPTLVCGGGMPVRPMDRQIETRTSDGKRRITPVFIPLTQTTDGNESLGSTGVPDGCFSTSSQSKSRIRVERRDDIIVRPNVSEPRAEKRSQDNGLDPRLRKRTATSLPGPRTEEVSGKRRAVASPPPPLAADPLPAPVLGIAGPIVRTTGAHRVQVVNNACNTPYGALARLQLLPSNSPSNDPLWETYVGSNVNCIACDSRWLCVACEDGSLHAWRVTKANASRALPPLALQSRAARLTLAADALAIITTAAELTAWDLATAECILGPISFRNLLAHGVTVTNLSLLEDGKPMVSLSSGKSYIYCKKLCAWVVWCDSGDPLWRSSRAALPARAPPTALGPYARAPPPATHTNLARSTQVWGATRSWLERQAATCQHLRMPKDYRYWRLAHITHLIDHGTEEQLRLVLDELLGPSHCVSVPKKWQPEVLGIKKHEMLEEILALLVKQLRWQRLYIEYSDQLSAIRASGNSTGMGTILNGH
ncbi:Protein HIRA homolog [Eumeta japonica]|uniref:Protein HIRA n=1 Tax=Eumeta variegata TaxID=151549 RepID=A0A4C1WZT2_EUMVA|nr:Protein HIRA homolog [Eumeta japonica]